jgi:hypothetical protein
VRWSLRAKQSSLVLFRCMCVRMSVFVYVWKCMCESLCGMAVVYIHICVRERTGKDRKGEK